MCLFWKDADAACHCHREEEEEDIGCLPSA